jgi:hypothetical protein
MNRIRTMFGVGALVLATVSQAQLPGGMTPPDAEYMPPIFLNRHVVADMHLSPAVAQKETSIIFSDGMALMGMMNPGAAGGTPDKKALMAKAFAAFKKMEDDSLAPLNSAQRARYRQLSLQFVGPTALTSPKLAHQLGLSDSQRAKIESAVRSSSKGMAGMASGMQGGSENMMAKYQQIQGAAKAARQSQEKALHAILTPAQWAKWNAMQGEKLPNIQDIFGSMGR